jgi:4-hydroxy-4-methyl-2-oxoglutarate aldolase
LTKLTDAQIIQELRRFDTGTICNVIATYPESDICLNLYDSGLGEYYTDTSIRCIYPELGPVCGYAATAWYSVVKGEHEPDQWLLSEHLDRTPKPIILAARQTFTRGLESLYAMFGGMMTAQFKALGVVGVVTDGAMRDYAEIKDQNVQYLATGFTSSHGPFHLREANIPITIGRMTIIPGEIIHMDQCGACKFPANRLATVLKYANELARRENTEKEFFQNKAFSLNKWKTHVQNKKKQT